MYASVNSCTPPLSVRFSYENKYSLRTQTQAARNFSRDGKKLLPIGIEPATLKERAIIGTIEPLAQLIGAGVRSFRLYKELEFRLGRSIGSWKELWSLELG